jgi:hypothetical protein
MRILGMESTDPALDRAPDFKLPLWTFEPDVREMIRPDYSMHVPSDCDK